MFEDGETCALCKQPITEEKQSQMGGDIIAVATMEDSKTFSFGLSGMYEFEDVLPLEADDLVCATCMNAHKFHVFKSVQCDCCKEKFQANYGGAKEGWGCAADVRHKDGKASAHAGFGSKWDMTRLYFKDIADAPPAGSEICDGCIDRLLGEDKMTKDSSFWDDMKAGDLLPMHIPKLSGEDGSSQQT